MSALECVSRQEAASMLDAPFAFVPILVRLYAMPTYYRDDGACYRRDDIALIVENRGGIDARRSSDRGNRDAR